jgi:Abnormal spindle-like microcephaly-assoc'd, ASPM-SPD-2-Hydin
VLLAGGAFTDAAAGGRICASDDTFTFGDRAVGSITTANATVTNCGDAPWSFTNVSVHSATGPAFQVSTTCTTGLTLAPGETCTVSVRFAPTTPGQTSGGLWLHNTTSTPDQLITFYGRGVDGQNGSASLAFVPARADFAAQAVGTQSMALTVELHNMGPAALMLSAIVLNGPEVYDFLGFHDTCQVGAAIAAGDSCHMSLYFRPQAAGIRRANLVIDSPQLALLAIMQISGTATSTATPTVDVIEFYNASQDHYFISSLQPDIDALDSGKFAGWVRTGVTFKAYPQPPPDASPVCRFYIPPAQGDSHFFSASAIECAQTQAKFPTFTLETPNAMYMDLPDTTTGACPTGDVPIYRVWDARVDSNHRYTGDLEIRAKMVAKGWVAEGYGPGQVIMCTPQ